MKFKFYDAQSKIYDFLQMPRLLYFDEMIKQYDEEQNYKAISSEEHLELMTNLRKTLKPFAEVIGTFYMKEIYNDYNFINLVTRVHTYLDFDNEIDFLNSLSLLSKNEIQISIIQAILIESEDYDDKKPDDIRKIAIEINDDQNERITLIKNLTIDDQYKWNLFLVIEEPEKYMDKYIELMNKLYPIFEETYAPFAERVQHTGNYLVDFFEENGPDGLETISFSTINGSLLKGDLIRIFISIIFPYSLVSKNDQGNSIVWGLDMEEAFKKLNEINEDKTNRRVHIFKNLGDKTRYEVLKLIASGVTSTKKIANNLNVSSATISYHINALVTSKVIKFKHDDKKYSYEVDFELLNKVWREFKDDLNID